MSNEGVTFEDIIDEYIKPTSMDDSIIITNDTNLDVFEDSLESYLLNRGFHKLNPTDLMKSIKARFSFLRRENIGDDEFISRLEHVERDVYELVWNKILTFYDIHVELDSNGNINENFFNIVEDFYYFFVHEYGENVKVLFHAYIIEHETELYDKFKINLKQKDVGINSLKNKLDKNPEAISTIYHIDDIVDMAISSMKEDQNTIMELMVNYDEDELTFNRMKNIFLINKEFPLLLPKGVLGPDFGLKFLEPLDDLNMKTQLIASLSSMLIEEYKILMSEEDEID